VSRRRSARHLVLLAALIALVTAGLHPSLLANVAAGAVFILGCGALIALDAASRHSGRR
jgi:hypothetical protein